MRCEQLYPQQQAYIGTVICAIIQVLALVSYFVAYFPGGMTTLQVRSLILPDSVLWYNRSHSLEGGSR